MRTYNVIQTRFWSWAKAHRLSAGARELAIYLLSSPHTNSVGCFAVPLGYIAEDLVTGSETVRERMAELTATGFAEYDETLGWVWITGFLKDNPIPNPNVAKSMIDFIEAVPRELPFYERFLDAFEPWSHRFADGVLNRFRDGTPNHTHDHIHDHDHEHTHESPEADASAGRRFDPAGDDPKPVLFGPEVRAFVGRHTGQRPDAVGRLIGKWCREFGQDHAALLEALGKAQDDPPGNLVQWIGGVVRQRGSPGSTDRLPLTYQEILAARDNDPAWRGVQ
jgi:hypothetical protein